MGRARHGIGRCGLGIAAVLKSGDERSAAPVPMLGGRPTREQGEEPRERRERDQGDEAERDQLSRDPLARRPGVELDLGQRPERDTWNDQRARHRATPMRRLGQTVRAARATPRADHMRNHGVAAVPVSVDCQGASGRLPLTAKVMVWQPSSR